MSLDFTLYLEVDVGEEDLHRATLYSANITHNLNTMAEACGVYNALWRPFKSESEVAGDIIAPLKKELKKLKASPEYYKKYNSPNGWGTYEYFVPFVEKALEACKKYPKAKIHRCV